MAGWIGSSGKKAEDRAAEFLKLQGFEILARNWRRPDCEIDIVARKLRSQDLHFFEVKYRKNTKFGSGDEYITKAKLKQLVYSANRYIQVNKQYLGYELGVITLGGPKFRIIQFIERLDL